MRSLKTISILTIFFVLMLSAGALAWNDGVYTGEAEGHNGPIIVEVKVEDSNIINIEIIEHAETPYLSDAGFEITDVIIEQQSLAVDAVGGATVTSEAVVAAVENALGTSSSKYTGEGEGFGGPIVVEVELEDGQISGITIISHSETPYLSDAAFDTIPAAIIAAGSTDVDAVSGATATSEGIIAAVNDALAN